MYFLHSDVHSSTAIMQLQREREEEQRQKVSIISTVLEKEYFYWRRELCSYIVIANFICITIKKILKYSIGNDVHRIVLYCTVCVHCYKGKNSCYPIYGLGYQDRSTKKSLGHSNAINIQEYL